MTFESDFICYPSSEGTGAADFFPPDPPLVDVDSSPLLRLARQTLPTNSPRTILAIPRNRIIQSRQESNLVAR